MRGGRTVRWIMEGNSEVLKTFETLTGGTCPWEQHIRGLDIGGHSLAELCYFGWCYIRSVAAVRISCGGTGLSERQYSQAVLRRLMRNSISEHKSREPEFSVKARGWGDFPLAGPFGSNTSLPERDHGLWEFLWSRDGKAQKWCSSEVSSAHWHLAWSIR
jgi:hypothetical protein